MQLKAVRSVSAGEEIQENYGPTFYFKSKKERQESLQSRYWFNCACAACQNKWPLLKNLKNKFGPAEDLKPFQMAVQLMAEGKAVEAFHVLCRLLSSVPLEWRECPSKDYILIEDKLRTCITNMGTVRVIGNK